MSNSTVISGLKCDVYVDLESTSGILAGDIGVLIQDTTTLGELTVVFKVSSAVTITSTRVTVSGVPVKLGAGNSVKIVRYTSPTEYTTLGTTGMYARAYE